MGVCSEEDDSTICGEHFQDAIMDILKKMSCIANNRDESTGASNHDIFQSSLQYSVSETNTPTWKREREKNKFWGEWELRRGWEACWVNMIQKRMWEKINKELKRDSKLTTFGGTDKCQAEVKYQKSQDST